MRISDWSADVCSCDLMLEALSARTVDAIGSDGDHPWFLPHIGFAMNVFQPNSDTIYRNARITPGGTYRLRGKRGNLPIFRMAQFEIGRASCRESVCQYVYI